MKRFLPWLLAWVVLTIAFTLPPAVAVGCREKPVREGVSIGQTFIPCNNKLVIETDPCSTPTPTPWTAPKSGAHAIRLRGHAYTNEPAPTPTSAVGLPHAVRFRTKDLGAAAVAMGGEHTTFIAVSPRPQTNAVLAWVTPTPTPDPITGRIREIVREAYMLGYEDCEHGAPPRPKYSDRTPLAREEKP